jgi:hypothetical protein
MRGSAGAVLAAAAFVAECDALLPVDRKRLAQGHVPARVPVADTLVGRFRLTLSNPS